MKKPGLFAAIAGLLLVSAAPPPGWSDDWEDDARTGGYPPCSRTVTDRCIQLYERGVATAANLALNERLGMNSARIAMGGPFEPAHEDAYDDGDFYADDSPYYGDGPGADDSLYADEAVEYGFDDQGGYYD
jgi:hypothetical protein